MITMDPGISEPCPCIEIISQLIIPDLARLVCSYFVKLSDGEIIITKLHRTHPFGYEKISYTPNPKLFQVVIVGIIAPQTINWSYLACDRYATCLCSRAYIELFDNRGKYIGIRKCASRNHECANCNMIDEFETRALAKVHLDIVHALRSDDRHIL